MIKIDTGDRYVDVSAISAMVDESQFVRITSRSRAVNITNKIIEAIQSHECPDQLDDYWEREDLVLDALHIFDPHVTEYLTDTYKEHRAALVHGGAYKSAQAVPHRTASGFPPAHDGKDDKGNDHDF